MKVITIQFKIWDIFVYFITGRLYIYIYTLGMNNVTIEEGCSGVINKKEKEIKIKANIRYNVISCVPFIFFIIFIMKG